MNSFLMNAIKYVLFMVFCAAHSFAADTDTIAQDLGDGLYLYAPADNTARLNKYAVVVHGFNVKPSLMEPAIKHLTKKGIPTILVSLSGHRPETQMSYDDWRADVKHGLAMAQALGNDGDEIIVLGHSLGGSLVSIEAAMSEVKIAKKMVLLAPANGLKLLKDVLNITLPVQNNLVLLNMAKIFFNNDHVFPGAGSQICGNNAYANDLTLKSFDALITSSEHSASKDFTDNLTIKTLVLVDKKDGLIDTQRIQTIFGNKDGCKVVILENAGDSVLAHTFQDEELLAKAMNEIIPFILDTDS